MKHEGGERNIGSQPLTAERLAQLYNREFQQDDLVEKTVRLRILDLGPEIIRMRARDKIERRSQASRPRASLARRMANRLRRQKDQTTGG